MALQQSTRKVHRRSCGLPSGMENQLLNISILHRDRISVGQCLCRTWRPGNLFGAANKHRSRA